MAKVDLPQAVAKVVAALDAAGVELHEVERDGQSYTRISIGKKTKDPLAFFQGAVAFVEFNLPGDSDKLLASGVDLVGLGNSSQGSGSSNPSP